MRLITIAGVDRTDDIKLSGFSINQVLTSQEDSCSFVVKSGDAPVSGQEIVVADDSIKLFAGIIDQVKEDHKGGGFTEYQCQARDYTFQLDKKMVVETYKNERAGDIFVDIIARYCSGFTSTGVHPGSPTVEYVVFDYKRPSDCFKELCDYVGWDWYVDYEKNVHFLNPSGYAAPTPTVIDESTKVWRLSHNIDMQGIRNRVYVRGGTMLSDFWTYKVKADGAARAWVLPHKPSEISIEVNGIVQSLGVENLHDESEYDFMMNYQEKYVRCSSGTATPLSGATLAFVYKYNIDVITMVEDADSQDAIAAVQGGDGVYEHSIVDDSLISLEAAEAVGNADLKEYGNPKIKGSFETEISGWEPSQLLEINLSTRGIIGTFLVQKVGIYPASTDQWIYRVEYGGRLLGIADFLKALVSQQQNQKIGDTAILSKFDRQTEAVGMSDELTITPRSLPYRCGDADALCGFVMLDSGGDWMFLGSMPVVRGDWD